MDIGTVRKINFLIAAGGTGGHLFPALAVVEELQSLLGDRANFIFIGSTSRIESKLIPKLGFEYHSLDIYGLSSLFTAKTLFLPYKLLSAILKAQRIIRNRNIDAVLAAGAYLSYPPGIAAAIENTPLFLMESNINPGKANKRLAKKAKLIFTAFEECSEYYEERLKNKLKPYGNPVRKNIKCDLNKSQARKLFDLNTNKPTLLVFGGSLGALTINKAIEANLELLSNSEFQVLWQTGENYIAPRNLPQNIKHLQFIENMGEAYKASDLVLSRSGASTIAELCYVGLPSILVPLPSASNNEQKLNAEFLGKKRAAELINNEDLKEKIYESITELLNNQNKLVEMGAAALSLAKPNAAKDCAKMISEYMNL